MKEHVAISPCGAHNRDKDTKKKAFFLSNKRTYMYLGKWL